MTNLFLAIVDVVLKNMTSPIKSYVYALTPREHLRLDEPVVKIGRTGRDPGRRLVEYPADSMLFRIKYVPDAVLVEKQLIKEFTARFERTPYGAEYFKGNVAEMLACFDKYACMPEAPQQCGGCKDIILGSEAGGFFCCGEMHYACIEQRKACAVCGLRFDANGIRVFTFGVPWHRASPVVSRRGTAETANVLVLYVTPGNHREAARYAYQSLMEDKWCYLWFSQEADWIGVDTMRLAALAAQVRSHGMLGALLFRPVPHLAPLDSIRVSRHQPRADFTST